MKKIILNLFFVLILSVNAFEVDSVGIVTYVVDGDTIDVLATSGFMNGSEYRIRFADINAPELDTEEGQEAKEVLKSLLYGKTVYIDVDNITTYDPYGRIVAEVYLQVNETHAMNVNYYMVLNNYSVIWDFTNNEFDPSTWTLYGELPEYFNTSPKYTFSTTPLFEDNFDYFDTTKWYNYDEGSYGSVVTINYLRMDKNCLSFENGTAIIKIYYNATDDKFHSYYMETYQEMGYGIYEARRKFTKSINTNFAFWLYSPKDKYRDYKNNSEIDWESGYNNGKAYVSTNYWYSDIFDGRPWSGFQICYNESELNISRLDWHVYKIEYTPTYIKWYIDDKLIRTAPGNMTVVAYNTKVSESPENLTESDTLRIFLDCAIVTSYNDSTESNDYIDHLYINPALKSGDYIGYHYIDWVRYYPLEGYNNTYYIDHLPYDIRKPGTYILTKNFTYENNETPIEIYVNDVIIDGNGNTLEGNILSSAIYSNTQRNITIKNINLKNWDKGIELRYINNTKLENVSVESSNYGVLLWELSNAKVDDIKSSNCSNGIYIIYSCNVSLTNISSKNNLAGVNILNSANISVENFIESEDENGIVILNSDDIDIYNSEGLDSSKIYNIMSSTHITLNNISGNNSVFGIYMDNTSESSIFRFIGKNNTYDICMKYSNNLNLSNSTLYGDYNIISSSSQNITVVNSYLAQSSTNWGCGIKLIDSSSFVFTKNTVVGKPSSFYIDENSTNNYIYLNNFINNSYKYCKNPNNSFKSRDKITYIFNSTVFKGYLGNYWSNYNGIDFDDNGIGKIPYIIDLSASDFFPLVKSYKYYILEIPDILINSINSPTTGTVEKGNSYNIQINITNIGTNDTVKQFNLTLLDNGNTAVGTTTINGLGVGEVKTLIFTWTPSTVGAHNLTAVVDSTNEVLELNETNNNKTVVISVISSSTTTTTTSTSSYTSHYTTTATSTVETYSDVADDIKSEKIKEIVHKSKLIVSSPIDDNLSAKYLKTKLLLTNQLLDINENVILIGGPVVNPIVKKYIWTFKVRISNDYPGAHRGVIQKQLINGHTVILLAGSDRWGTKASVEYFKTLNDLPDEPIFVEWKDGKAVKIEKP